jgi:hypothetical protein
VAVIVSVGGVIDYCFASDTLEQAPRYRRLRKGSALPPHSLTANFNRNPENIAGAAQAEGYSQLNDWFEDTSVGIEMKEDVVGLGSYGKTLTVLFTEEALPDEEDRDNGDDVDDD